MSRVGKQRITECLLSISGYFLQYKKQIIIYIKRGIVRRTTMPESQQILEILKTYYKINIITVEFLRDVGGISYIISDNNQKYLLKIIKQAFINTCKQSIDIMIYLANQDFPVPKIIRTEDEKPYVITDENGIEIVYVLFEFIEGREPELGEKIEEIGELTGKLHVFMKKYDGKLTVRDRSFYIDRYIDILRRKKYPEEKLSFFIQYGNELWGNIKDLPKGYCHGDLHRGNLLLTQFGSIYMFDFDTSCYAFPVFDIMVMCDETNYFDFDIQGYNTTTSIYQQFLKGYIKYNSLTDLEISAFYKLIAVHHYQLQATIIELFGLDCIDEKFIDNQRTWLMNWREQCKQLLY